VRSRPVAEPTVVAKRSTPRRARSRKRRPDPQAAPPRAPGVHGAERPGRAERAGQPGSQRRVGLVSDLKAAGKRPPPPWHPLPLSELLILVGTIGAVVAWARGYQHNAALLGAGIGAVVLGTIEVTLREHLSGFRPHTTMLAVIPAIVFHSVVVLVWAAIARVPRWLNYALLPIDVALVAVSFKLLRARYADARRARTTALGR
jgi:hypothetical protein